MNEDKIKELENKIQDLEAKVASYDAKKNEYATLVSPFVSGTPTNNGYVTLVVNGKRHKFATVT